MKFAAVVVSLLALSVCAVSAFYSKKDGIVTLTKANFDQIFDDSLPWLLEFYGA